MKFTFDEAANAGYVKITDKPITETTSVNEKGSLIQIDLDADGEVVGIEIVNFK